MPVYTQVTSMKDTIFPFFKLLYSFLGILLTTVCYYSRGHCWNTCIIMLYSVFTVSSTKIKSSTNYNGFSVSKLILWTIKLSRFNYLPYISDLNVHPQVILQLGKVSSGIILLIRRICAYKTFGQTDAQDYSYIHTVFRGYSKSTDPQFTKWLWRTNTAIWLCFFYFTYQFQTYHPHIQRRACDSNQDKCVQI